MECLTCPAHLLLRSAQEGRQEMSPHLTDLPTTVGALEDERSQYCPGRETKAWGKQLLAPEPEDWLRLATVCQSAWNQHPGLLPPWPQSWTFLKLPPGLTRSLGTEWGPAGLRAGGRGFLGP